MNLLIAAEASGPFGIVLPATSEIVWGALAFFIVFFALKKLAFPQLGQLLDDRAAAIQGKMEEADGKLVEAEKAKADFEAGLADARGEAGRIIEDAKQTAESLRRDIVAKAEDEAAGVLEKARADVRAERERLLQELRAQVGVMSVELASRIVERELDASTHQLLVDEYIQDLSRAN
jgi:F-type H+-transporting ATPase subunit b